MTEQQDATGERVRVGATVRHMREMRGMTPTELASAVDISRAYLVNIEAGRKRLTPVLAAKVADALAVPQIAIVSGTAA